MQRYGEFDFGLTTDQEERAARLHKKSLIIDMLYQGPLGSAFYPEDLSSELRDFWEKRGDLLETLIKGLGLPAIRAAEERLDTFRKHWFASGVTGGVIGIVTVPFFLKESPGADMNDFLDHLDYLAKLVGTEHLGIGTDWPMQLPQWTLEELFLPMVKKLGFREEHQVDPTASVIGFSDYLDFPNITRGLVSRNYSEEQIEAILGGNFLRVFERACG